jgi:hypothetical protein
MRNPKPEEMVRILIQAAEADYWNHYDKDFSKHSYDWLSEGEMNRRMSHDEYRNLPISLAQHSHVELCTYIYKGKRVWGYYREKLQYGNQTFLLKRKVPLINNPPPPLSPPYQRGAGGLLGG